jgi:hypothetical protein
MPRRTRSARRVDVVDRQDQALNRARLARGDAFAEGDRTRRLGGGELDHPEGVADGDVGVQPPAEALVEALGPVDVGDGQRHDLEFHVDGPGFGHADLR